ncbi:MULTISPECIES: DNA repair protein RecO [Methylomonas]|uniref:DNA repair protein RecO n=2 Tax=Methylomonas TaxID=416 RepID=A0A126T0V4_9GAMM|nr:MULTISPECIES: DNA repair protein RecO [Methylomonas]AMK75721.1 DNA repair protein RecO [Methylomonas denitrificans]OAH98285.1 DNA repair protein RecO [Methylomonas methanica]TCV82452.1 DNA replication and repair protein RecO [Methylomonas methanica]
MNGSAVYLQPAFVLQHRPYREACVLLDVFTRDFGVVSMLAKGVRKEKSKIAGLLLPFSALRLSFVDKNELKVLSQVEYVDSYPLERLALYCGFYVNELVQIFVHKYDPQPEIFSCYERCLSDLLLGERIEQTLRYFELDLLQEAGYAVAMDYEGDGKPIQTRQRYNFLADFGMVADSEGLIGGETLSKLSARAPLEGRALVEAKLLFRKMLDGHLQGRPLKSRDVLAKIIKYL